MPADPPRPEPADVAPSGPARRFRDARRPTLGLHLDSAAAGRSSRAVLDAVTAHALEESVRGAAVALRRAAPVLEEARAQALDLLGGQAGAAFAFTHSATDGLGRVVATLLATPEARRAGVLRVSGEYTPNAAVWRAAGARDRVATTSHRIGADELDRALRRARPAFVHLTWVGSHVGTVQDVAPLLALARDHGVLTVVDVAQAFGHVDTRAAAGADVVYGTSRKWLGGPRGVGFCVARGHLAARASGWEPFEGHHAGRVGFARALAELHDLGPGTVFAGLAAVGARTRAVLADLPAWTVVEGSDGADPSATTTLRPRHGTDVAATVDRLARAGVLVTAARRERSEEMTDDVLRVSPHLDVTEDDLVTLHRHLLAPPTGARGDSLPQ